MTQKQLIQYNSDFLIDRFFLDLKTLVFDQAFKNTCSHNFLTYPNNQAGLLYLYMNMDKSDNLIIHFFVISHFFLKTKRWAVIIHSFIYSFSKYLLTTTMF